MQTRRNSLFEAIVGAFLAWGQVLVVNFVVAPAYGFKERPWHEVFALGGTFVTLTAIRHYIVRRVFNRYTDQMQEPGEAEQLIEGLTRE